MKIVTGFHAIEEKVRAVAAAGSASAKIELFYAKPGPRVKKIIVQARQTAIKVIETASEDLDAKTADLPAELQDHRGIVMIVHEDVASNEVDFDAFLKTVQSKNSVVLILDGITDPHNMGAIIRSCDQFAADLVIVPSRGSANSGDVIERSSAGAIAWVPVAVVPNLTRAAEQLKAAGFWVYGADAGGDSVQQTTIHGKVALVMGSEGTGISRLLKESCDGILSIPTSGRIDSLNVSVAAGIFLYEIRRQNPR